LSVYSFTDFFAIVKNFLKFYGYSLMCTVKCINKEILDHLSVVVKCFLILSSST